MADINVRSDSVDVEQIMQQIRARIREKRGADYTEAELQQLATVKLEKFLDPRGVRSDLIEQFRRQQVASEAPPNYTFEDSTIYETHRGLLRTVRRLLNPVLKLFMNPAPISAALHLQSELNARNHRQREAMDSLFYEVIHNLVVETTRLGIEVQNLKMRVESLSARLDFDERRGRALESVVEYRPDARRRPEDSAGGDPGGDTRGEGGERKRRRRRRRRKPGQTAADSGGDSGDRSGGREPGEGNDRPEGGRGPESGDRTPDPPAAPASDDAPPDRNRRGSPPAPGSDPSSGDPGASNQ